MNELADGIKKTSKRGKLFGILVVILGILAMMSPLVAGKAVAMMVAIMLIVAGIFRLMWAFQAETFGKGALTFLVGGLTLVAGVLMLMRPYIGLASLTMLLAAYFLVDGIFEIIAAFKVKPEQGWGWLLFGGIVSAALGWMIWKQWPVSGVWAIGILVGVKMLFAGIEMIALGAVGTQIGKGVEEVSEAAGAAE